MSNRYFPLGAEGTASVEAHFHTSEEVQVMVDRAKEVPMSPLNYVLFLDGAVDELRKNPGHAGFAIVDAHTGEHPTRAIYSVDANGHFLTGPGIVVIQNGQPCPPECVRQLPPSL